MRKKVLPNQSDSAELAQEPQWLDLERLARAEMSSEDPAFPLEEALRSGGGGWRAAGPGDQVIRLLFDEPQRLSHLRLRFVEEVLPRTQEFTLRWSADGGQTFREIVRQQFTFSPPGTVLEEELYDVSLDRVTVLELRLLPEISGGSAHATLQLLQLA